MKALSIGLACACAALVAGCATTRIDAQWVDPQRTRSSLVGSQVLVDCIGPDTTLQRLCSQHLAMQLSQRGVRPLTLDAPARVGTDQVAASDAEMLDKARSLGAQAVLRASVTPEVLVASPGPSVGLGVGGFGGGWGGYGGSGVGVSLGLGFPVGGSNVKTGYAAKGALSDVASGRLVWSANASTPATADVGEQLKLLTQALVDAAAQQGLF